MGAGSQETISRPAWLTRAVYSLSGGMPFSPPRGLFAIFLETSVREARTRAAHEEFCSLDSLEGLLEVGDHIPSVLDTNREAH
jgi:hypothetical protein